MLKQLTNPELNKKILRGIHRLAPKAARKLGRPAVLMEVCGTHTMTISRSGLRSLLEASPELRSGPGCPVCVTDRDDLDRMIALARQPGMVIATFGDLLRVPGSEATLEQERARGARVEICYSPLDAAVYAAGHPEKEVVFLGVGFETTAPAVALSVAYARSKGLQNYSVLAAHKLVPPVLAELLSDPELTVDGLILPGHVCTVTGRKAFDFIASEYRVPAVIAGFEPVDILEAVYLLLERILDGRAETVNNYTRLVREEGNQKAREVMGEYFKTEDVSWRGFGVIPGSGLVFNGRYAFYDAAARYPVTLPASPPPEGCACGAVLKGKITPAGCPLFAGACTPLRPVGPCMVSSEGSCAAFYHYERDGAPGEEMRE